MHKKNNPIPSHHTHQKQQRKNVQKLLTVFSEGLLETSTDLVLYLLFLTGSLAGATTSSKIYRAFEETTNLTEKINYKTLKKSLYNSLQNKLIRQSGDKKRKAFLFTDKGKKALFSLIPRYNVVRSWNHTIYLISYDIPTKANKTRNHLRHYLLRIHCALLQESLWVTPYDPHEALHWFVETYAMQGTILISKLGQDGAIGDENLEDLVRRVYKLDALNKRYAKFIERFNKKEDILSPMTVSMAYHVILRDDPQLPFALLPRDFLGQKAYRRYREICG